MVIMPSNNSTQLILLFNKGIVKEGILGVLELRWRSLFTNYRKKVKNTEQDLDTAKKSALAQSK